MKRQPAPSGGMEPMFARGFPSGPKVVTDPTLAGSPVLILTRSLPSGPNVLIIPDPALLRPNVTHFFSSPPNVVSSPDVLPPTSSTRRFPSSPKVTTAPAPSPVNP